MGKVIATCTSEIKGVQKKNVHQVCLIEDYGIEGDAHAGKWHRQVSLLSYDRIQEFRARGAKGEDGAAVSTEDMEDVDLYMHCLGVPARRNVNDPQVQKGEQKFYEAKCHLCHVTTLHTKVRGATLLNGTELPWLGNQTIHPYSDFLLHDMGSEIMGVGLNDNYVSGLARGNEWRTTPLWGIGLQEVVNGHTYFLHDGRARNLVEAIMWHGGEAEASKNLFKRMSKEDRDALIAFLNSL